MVQVVIFLSFFFRKVGLGAPGWKLSLVIGSSKVYWLEDWKPQLSGHVPSPHP